MTRKIRKQGVRRSSRRSWYKELAEGKTSIVGQNPLRPFTGVVCLSAVAVAQADQTVTKHRAAYATGSCAKYGGSAALKSCSAELRLNQRKSADVCKRSAVVARRATTVGTNRMERTREMRLRERGGEHQNILPTTQYCTYRKRERPSRRSGILGHGTNAGMERWFEITPRSCSRMPRTRHGRRGDKAHPLQNRGTAGYQKSFKARRDKFE